MFHFRWAGVLLLTALAVPVFAADKKDDKPDKDKKDGMVSAGVLTGTLSIVESQTKYLTLQIPVPVVQPGGVGGGTNAAALQSLLIQQQQALMIRNPVQRMVALRQVAIQAQALRMSGGTGGGGRVSTRNQDLELKAADDIKVRLLQPPLQFDEKGRIKKYTRKELDELKGPDKSLPGYQGDFDNLKAGQTVKVYLVKKKTAPKPPGKKKDDGEDLEEKRPSVRMVIILAEPKDK
jgi:hypothetical protein